MGGKTAINAKDSTSAESARDKRLIGAIRAIVFLAHMVVSGRYGYFVDGVGICGSAAAYCHVHLAGARGSGRFASGIAILTRGGGGIAGGLTGYIARELRAPRFAIALSCVCVAGAPLNLRRPVWLEGNGAGGGGGIPQVTARRAKALWDFWTKLRTGRSDRFCGRKMGLASGDVRPRKLFLPGGREVSADDA